MIQRISRSAAAMAAVFAATLLAYAPALRAGFIWDDDGHVTRVDLRGWEGLARIWTRFDATQQYYPVLHSAFWVEHRIWGDSAAAYHLLNILLHATAACLFARLLLAWRGPEPAASTPARGPVWWAAWAAALLFALHPVEVESVAWISEQKNTLSTVFALLAALAYWRFQWSRTVATYAGALALFGLAVFTKSVTVTLPAVLLAVLWWKQGTLSWRRDVLPLLPWLALGAGAGLTTAWIERTYVGAEGTAFDLSWLDRLQLAGRVFTFYAGKLIWPRSLIFIYPRWTVDAGQGLAWWGLIVAGAGAVAAVLLVRRTRGPLAAYLCYAGMLFPALGFFNVYPFVFSYVADHFQYFASLAVFAAVAGGWERALLAGPAPRRAAAIALAAALIALGLRTRSQAAIYESETRLYETTLAENPDAWLAHANLGAIEGGAGQLSQAIEHYQAALRLNSGYAQVQNNLGNAYNQLHRWDEAERAYAEAVRLRPSFGEAQLNWGNLLSDRGDYTGAEAHFREAIRLRPADATGFYRLGCALANRNDLADAVGAFGQALKLRPAYPEAEANLGLALVVGNQVRDALPHLQRAVTLDPRYAEGQAYLGLAYAKLDRLDEAAAQFRRAIALNPRDSASHYQLAQVLGQQGDFRGARQEQDLADRLSR